MNRTQRFPINQLILEGPDLAGKTSFYQALHKKSGYKWNIQDRSALSMLIYAKLYNRDTFIEVERLNRELKNLNNVYVILLPPWDEVGRRFNDRGDEIQNLASLRKLYDLFAAAASELESYPNVIVIRSKDTLGWVENVIKSVVGIEISTPSSIASYVFNFAKASDNFEATPVNLTFYDDGNFKHCDMSVLEYEKEREYYEKIQRSVFKKIADELEGNNEYNRKESIESRRFIYTDNSCISFAQFIARDNILDCHYVLRSSDTKNTLKYDLPFLYILSSKVYDQLGITNFKCRIRINFNSAHIII